MEMTLQTIEFDKERLYNRCSVDIATHGENDQPQIDMCEHDRAWFSVALTAAANVVLCELRRISKGIDLPITEDQDKVSFTVNSCGIRSRLLPEAIERYLISHVVNLWYTQRLNRSVLDLPDVLSDLNHITLINNSVTRKSYF